MLWGIDMTQDGKYIVATSSNQTDSYEPRYKPNDKQRISNVVFIDATTNEVVKILRKINDLGTTVILTTHNRSVIEQIKKRVITLESGRVVRDDKDGKYMI